MKQLFSLIAGMLILSGTSYAQFNEIKSKTENIKVPKISKAKNEVTNENNDSNPSSTEIYEQNRISENQRFASEKTYKDFFYQQASLAESYKINNSNGPCDYKDFIAKKTEYSESKMAHNEITDNYISELNDFYTVYMPNDHINKNIESFERRGNRWFVKDEWAGQPQEGITKLNSLLKDIENIERLSPVENQRISTLKQNCISEKAKIEDYLNNGEYAIHQREFEKSTIENRRLNAAKMSDSEVENYVKTNIDSEKYGSPLRVVIISPNWIVEKNSFDIPEYKYVKVEIATKKADGSCYCVKGSVGRTYEGGGNYGGLYMNIYYTEGEMNCENVNK